MNEELRKALTAVMNESNDPYAQAYASVAFSMSGRELAVQVLYVRANLQYWRGQRAREVKAVLDKYKA